MYIVCDKEMAGVVRVMVMVLISTVEEAVVHGTEANVQIGMIAINVNLQTSNNYFKQKQYIKTLICE